MFLMGKNPLILMEMNCLLRQHRLLGHKFLNFREYTILKSTRSIKATRKQTFVINAFLLEKLGQRK